MFDKILNKATIPLIVLIVLLVSSNISWYKDHWKGIIGSDGKGYYAHLPAAFIYQDLHFGFFDVIDKDKYYHKNQYYDYRYDYQGKVVNKYLMGTSIPMLPFFLMGHFITVFSDQPMDGYSKWYQILINIGAIFYLALGCVYVKKLLRMYNIGVRNTSLVLFALVFGTNVFYYTIGEPSMSHIYSFALMSMFIYYAKKYFKDALMKDTLILAFLFGLITLIRPVNSIIILILPFVAGSFEQLKSGVLKLLGNSKYLIGGSAIALAIIMIQPLLYKIQTGEFFIYTYEGEGFNFLDPAIFDILFSYKKGLFLYTPLLFIALFGFRRLYVQRKFEFYSLAIFLVFLTYILSSWWNWWYGGSFSGRAYLEYLPLFAILLGHALESFTGMNLKRAYVSLILILIVVCQIQTFQYRYYFIHWSEMTQEKYWDVFLRVDLLMKPKG